MVNFYIGQLRYNEVLNRVQCVVLQAALTLNIFRQHRVGVHCEVLPFLTVLGVPECGKTLTLVYTLATFLVQFAPRLRSLPSTSKDYRVLVLTETKKALDVICDRLQNAHVQVSFDSTVLEVGNLPYYCSRSAAYTRRMRREDVNLQRVGGRSPTSSPILLCTFGNLASLVKELRDELLRESDSMSFDEFVKETFTVVVFDQASHTNKVKISLFLHLFPSFDGIIVM